MSDMSEDPIPTPESAPVMTPRRSWVKPVLFVSLAANLLVFGTFAGAMFHGFHNPDMRHRTALADSGLAPFVEALPKSVREDLGKELVRNAGRFSDNRQKLAVEIDEMLRLLRQDEFDRAAAMASLGRQSVILEARRTSAAEIVVARLAELSREERIEFAEKLENFLKRRRD